MKKFRKVTQSSLKNFVSHYGKSGILVLINLLSDEAVSGGKSLASVDSLLS